MDAHEHVLLARHIALDDGDVALAVERTLIRLDAEVTVAAREVDVGNLLDEALRALAVLDERLNRDDVESVFFRKFFQLGRAHHVPVVRHDLTAKPRGIESCQACEIRCRLRVARAPQHAALDRTQREYMTRTAEGRWPRFRIEQELDRLAAFESRDARIRIVGVDGNRERRLVIVRVVHDHLPDIQLIEPLAVDRRADQPLRVLRHEIDILRLDRRCRNDEIALVLTIFIVHDDNHSAVLDILDCLLHRCKI